MNPPCPIPEAEIARLEALVRDRVHGRVRGLRIHVEDRGLVLYGRARTYYAKQIAQHAAMAACGLPIAVNAIEVT